MNALLALPFLVPLIGAGITLLPRALWVKAATSVGSLVIVVASAGLLLWETTRGTVVTSQAGGWPAPLGITLVADTMAALLLLVSSLVLLIVLLYAIGQDIGGLSRAAPEVFHPVYLILTAGVGLSFLSGDLFNLFVAFEVMLTASYTLITHAPTRARVRASMIYTVVSLTSSILFITGIALVYALTGTVNLADVAVKLEVAPAELRMVLALLFLVVFGIKAALVPLHFWLPDSYPVALTRISAIFAALLTKVAVYAIIRTQTLLFVRDDVTTVLLCVAVATMIVGILGALVQDDLNRVLSFALVSHIGFMIFGLGLNTVAGFAGMIVYLVHHIVVQATLFLVNGLVRAQVGHTSLRALRGLATVSPAMALLFFFPALSLVGIPPFSGFIAKVALFEAGLAAGDWLSLVGVGAGVLTSLLTLIAVFRIWVRAFWGTPLPGVAAAGERSRNGANLAGLRIMTAMTGVLVLVGLGLVALAGPLVETSFTAARELLDTGPYIEAVLGGGQR